MLSAVSGRAKVVLTSRTQQGLMPFKPRNEALQAHEDVAAAVAGGDCAVAERAMHHILDEVREALEIARGVALRQCRLEAILRIGHVLERGYEDLVILRVQRDEW